MHQHRTRIIQLVSVAICARFVLVAASSRSGGNRLADSARRDGSLFCGALPITRLATAIPQCMHSFAWWPTKRSGAARRTVGTIEVVEPRVHPRSTIGAALIQLAMTLARPPSSIQRMRASFARHVRKSRTPILVSSTGEGDWIARPPAFVMSEKYNAVRIDPILCSARALLPLAGKLHTHCAWLSAMGLGTDLIGARRGNLWASLRNPSER